MLVASLRIHDVVPEREFRVVVRHDEAKRACKGQRYTLVTPLDNLPTKVPNPDQKTAIICRAEVAFCLTSLGEKVTGIPSEAFGECVMSPEPNCKRCRVAFLQEKIRGTEKTVSIEEYDRNGDYVFLREAGIDMTLILEEGNELF